MLFREDIELEKVAIIDQKINQLLPKRTQELRTQITELDTLILNKEKERAQVIAEVTDKPVIETVVTSTKCFSIKIQNTDGLEKDTIICPREVTISDVENPKTRLIPQLDTMITKMRTQKGTMENERFTIRQDLGEELKSKQGFLDELTILFSILLTHHIALTVWLSIFIFFLSIELFVLVNKFGDHKDDYDEVVIHQLNTHKVRLKKLSENKNEISMFHK